MSPSFRQNHHLWHKGADGLTTALSIFFAFLLARGALGFGVSVPSSITGFRATTSTSTCTRSEPLRSSFSTFDDTATAATTTSSHHYARVVGNWEELHGNFLLRPSIEKNGAPRALIHFLGGAIVGASPHISYRYLLERLAEKGYLIVATPYSLSFDHLSTCDAAIARFERIAPLLARTYGALPVVGVGHSCGALLHLLITSLFPDTPRAANALISFNNKPVSEAVPFFETFFAPFFTYAAARNDTSRNSGSEIISVGLKLAKAAVNGHVPSDDLLSRACQLMSPPSSSQRTGGAGGFDFFTQNVMGNVVDSSSGFFGGGGGGGGDRAASIPFGLRDAFSRMSEPSRAAFTQSGILPFLSETLETLEQIPKLIDEVADGARDFNPTPARVKAAARRAYRARSTLILGYDNDNLDESDEIEELLSAAGQVIQMKRPMIQIDVQRRKLPGGHAAPLLAPPLDVATRAETILGAEVAKDTLAYESADKTVEELIRWLEQSNL